jgi:2-hydroxy-3-keto-5-methylthiopentenyl-1-phosphate phosphatase
MRVNEEAMKAMEVLNEAVRVDNEVKNVVKAVAENIKEAVVEAVKVEGMKRIAEATDTKGIENVAMQARKVKIKIDDKWKTRALEAAVEAERILA